MALEDRVAIRVKIRVANDSNYFDIFNSKTFLGLEGSESTGLKANYSGIVCLFLLLL